MSLLKSRKWSGKQLFSHYFRHKTEDPPLPFTSSLLREHLAADPHLSEWEQRSARGFLGVSSPPLHLPLPPQQHIVQSPTVRHIATTANSKYGSTALLLWWQQKQTIQPQSQRRGDRDSFGEGIWTGAVGEMDEDFYWWAVLSKEEFLLAELWRRTAAELWVLVSRRK